MLVSTKTSVYLVPHDGSVAPRQVLNDLEIRRVQMNENRFVFALGDGYIKISHDEKQKTIKSGISDRIDSLLIVKDEPLTLLIGCTPPNLYRLVDVEGNAQLVDSFQSLNVRNKWYTPWGGSPAVRSMAMTSDGWVYADIHVGSIMRSPDYGENWEPVNPTLHKDVHEVAICPNDPNRVYANTYLSVYVSEDRGETWSHRSGALKERYGRGIAVHPHDPEILLCGVSDGPSGENVHGQLYWTGDAGRSWEHVKDGFPVSTRRNIDTFHICFEGDNAWVSDGNKLYLSKDKGRSFLLYWSAPEKIISLHARAVNLDRVEPLRVLPHYSI